MKIVFDKKNEWWICSVTNCREEIAFGGNRLGTGVAVCQHHQLPGDKSIRDEGIPLDEEEGIWLNYDDREENWWIEQWYDGTVIAIDDNPFKTLAAALKAWDTGDYDLVRNE
jgi:hypothetical protein